MSSYPEDLIPIIKKACSVTAKQKFRSAPPLPADGVTRALLDVSYHASFEVDEGRRPGFRLMLYSPADHERSTGKKPGKSGSDQRFRLVPLDKERPFTVAEVCRLGPAAEFRRLLICVRCGDGGPSGPALYIWALMDVGENWWKFVHHETEGGMPPPNFLTVSSTGPGQLTVSAGGTAFATLRGGKIATPRTGALWRGPVSEFLDVARKQLYADAVARLGGRKYDEEGHDDDYPSRFYNFFLERILFYAWQRGHGGAIIVIPSCLKKDDTRLTDRTNIKYPCQYSHAWELLARSLVTQKRFYDLYFRLWDAPKSCTRDEFREYCRLSDERESIDEALSDVAQAVASLTSVDGAVVMNDRFDVLGFGAEVTAPSPSLSQVLVAAGRGSRYAVPVESFGTRHRSAFRLCSSLEESVAFVLSQDGGVKAVKRHGPDVFLWPDINPGWDGAFE